MTSTNNTAYFVLHDLVCESMPLDSPLLSIHAGTTLLYCPDTDQQGSEYFYATLKGNHSTYNFSNNTLSLRIQLVVQWSAQRNTMPLPPARFTFITCLHTFSPTLTPIEEARPYADLIQYKSVWEDSLSHLETFYRGLRRLARLVYTSHRALNQPNQRDGQIV